MITVKGLTKRYARTVAVDHISFEVQKGQIVGFLGPNGAGKDHDHAHADLFSAAQRRQRQRRRLRRARAAASKSRSASAICPETPPLYPEMEVARIPDLRRQAQGLSGAEPAPSA